MSLEDDVKSWLTSKSVWGGILAGGSAIASAVFKLEFPVDFTVEMTNAIVGFFGAALAIYGRIKAVKKIK